MNIYLLASATFHSSKLDIGLPEHGTGGNFHKNIRHAFVLFAARVGKNGNTSPVETI